jgi:putative ABC transport system substrate-binding protein
VKFYESKNLALCLPADAQQPAKFHRIGYLAGGASSFPQPLLHRLRELGYSEGKNLVIEFRTTGGKPGRGSELVADLLRTKVEIIIAEGTGLALAAKKATSTAPIIMTGATDPVATGLVEDFMILDRDREKTSLLSIDPPKENPIDCRSWRPS